MSTFVLIHGAWLGGWCWYRVIPRLEQRGHTVVALDLPSHGRDKTPLGSVPIRLLLSFRPHNQIQPGSYILQ
jgi:pimeloyl-ACP methyl ester carboxylesterase